MPSGYFTVIDGTFFSHCLLQFRTVNSTTQLFTTISVQFCITLYMIYFSFPLASCKWKACIAQGQTFSETAMVTNHLHGNSKSLQIVSDLWGLLGETELVRRSGGAMMDPVPLDDGSGIGCVNLWITTGLG